MNWRILLRSPFWLHALIIAACTYVVWDGTGKPFRYKMFPYVIVGIIITFSVAELVRHGIGRIKDRKRDTVDLSVAALPDLSLTEYDIRSIRFIIWLIILIALFYILGPTFAVALFMALYLSIEVRMWWVNRVLIVAAMTLMTQYLFIWALDLTVPEGLLARIIY